MRKFGLILGLLAVVVTSYDGRPEAKAAVAAIAQYSPVTISWPADNGRVGYSFYVGGFADYPDNIVVIEVLNQAGTALYFIGEAGMAEDGFYQREVWITADVPKGTVLKIKVNYSDDTLGDGKEITVTLGQ